MIYNKDGIEISNILNDQVKYTYTYFDKTNSHYIEIYDDKAMKILGLFIDINKNTIRTSTNESIIISSPAELIIRLIKFGIPQVIIGKIINDNK